MTVMFFERPAAGLSWWQAIADAVGRIANELRRESKARRDRRHLMQLPDYLLRDIGISRLEVEAMTERDDRPRFIVVPDINWRQTR
jgi:uncharacterized protein YjiS (DUF1127 family)